MQTKFLETRKAVANLGRSHVSPSNLLVHADLVVLDQLAKGDEPSE